MLFQKLSLWRRAASSWWTGPARRWPAIRRRKRSVGLELLEDRVTPALPGFLDTSFGVDGALIYDVNPAHFEDSDAAMQADGKFLAVGYREVNGNGNYLDACVFRSNADGTIDTDFGVDGKVEIDFGGSEAFRAVEVQQDGKIVVGGTSNGDRFILARLHSDGSLDESFGEGGKVKLIDYGIIGQLGGITIQPDGKILIAGASGGLALIRLNSDGTIDQSFGSGGVTVTSTGFYYGYFRVARVLPDGSILAAGRMANDYEMAVAHYFADGTQDMQFGDGGLVSGRFRPTDFSSVVDDLVVQRDGKMLIGGFVGTGAGGEGQFGILRLRADSTRDNTFGVNGLVVSNYSEYTQRASAIRLQEDGKLVVVGLSYYSSFITRLNPDGGIDHTFGTNQSLGRTKILDLTGQGRALPMPIFSTAKSLWQGG